MALTVTNRGSGANKTAGTRYTFSPASTFAAGSLAVLVIACDNAGTDGADPITGVTDDGGNTWTQRQAALNDPGGASAGAVCRIYTAPVVSLTTSVVITVAFGAVSVTAKAYTLTQIGPAATYVTGGVDNATAGGVT